jgi:hypothetical protein
MLGVRYWPEQWILCGYVTQRAGATYVRSKVFYSGGANCAELFPSHQLDGFKFSTLE